MTDPTSDQPTSVSDPGLDVAALQAEITAAAAAKRRTGVYTDEFLRTLDQPLDIDPDPRFAGGDAWPEVEATTDVTLDAPLVSTRPVVGTLIVAGKRAVRRALRWHLWPVTDRITVHNRAVTAVLAEHGREVGRLRIELDALRDRVAELEREPEETP